jgi:hypothetical protein
MHEVLQREYGVMRNKLLFEERPQNCWWNCEEIEDINLVAADI